MFNYRRTTLSIAVLAALGVSTSADAGTITASWTGAFTMLGATGGIVISSDTNQCYPSAMTGPGVCERTAISGTLTFNTFTGAGSSNIAPFSFFGLGNISQVSPFIFQLIGDGLGGPGTLVLGNMSYNWNGGNGIPVSIVWDASGFLGALSGGLQVSQTLSGTGALPASDNTDTVSGGGGTTYPIGPALLATTAWNTTKVGTPFIGMTGPSGTLPLVTDTVVDVTNGDLGVGGSPMPTAPFPGFNANFDILSMTVTSCTPDICPPAAVPVPAAIWLFASGLAGLIGIARRKRWNTDKRHDA